MLLHTEEFLSVISLFGTRIERPRPVADSVMVNKKIQADCLKCDVVSCENSSCTEPFNHNFANFLSLPVNQDAQASCEEAIQSGKSARLHAYRTQLCVSAPLQAPQFDATNKKKKRLLIYVLMT